MDTSFCIQTTYTYSSSNLHVHVLVYNTCWILYSRQTLRTRTRFVSSTMDKCTYIVHVHPHVQAQCETEREKRPTAYDSDWNYMYCKCRIKDKKRNNSWISRNIDYWKVSIRFLKTQGDWMDCIYTSYALYDECTLMCVSILLNAYIFGDSGP